MAQDARPSQPDISIPNPRRDTRLLFGVALLLLALGAGLRLFDLTDEPIDFHSTRQLRSAIIARGMYYEMLPEADPVLRQQAAALWASTGQYEPSILERAAALGYLALGHELPWLGRLFNSLFWCLGGIAIFDLARRMTASGQTGVSSGIGALAALAYYLVLPFGVQASRAFQPDPSMTTWIVLAAWCAYRWSEQPGWWRAILTGIAAGMAILTKAVAFYAIAGMLFFVVYYANRSSPPRFLRSISRMLRSPQAWTMAILAIMPTLAYYLTRGERASEYLSAWTFSLSHLLLQPLTYLRWLNLLQELLNPLALVLGLIGVILATGQARFLLAGMWLGYLAYGLFLPYQMTTHSYYHLQMVPIVALSLAPSIQRISDWVMPRGRAWQASAAALALVILGIGAWQALVPLYGRDYRNEPAYWQEIASYLPQDGKIIALTQDYGYRLMYYGWRKVVLWPNRGEIRLSVLRGSDKDFREFFTKRIEGKSYFLITAFNQFEDQPDLQDTLYENFPVVAEGNGYIIFDLLQPKSFGLNENLLAAEPECHPFR